MLRLLVGEHTKRQIAAELFIAHSTVHPHTVHIYVKCGVSTRAGLAPRPHNNLRNVIFWH